MTAAEIIALLDLQKHPEGGWFKEVFRDDIQGHGRAYSTAIYFLLEAGQVSAWHKVDAAEGWHWYAGAPLILEVSTKRTEVQKHILSSDLSAGHRPQFIIPAHAWQRAWSEGEWTLVGCTVAPGFEFSGFEMAPENWSP